MQNYKTSHRKNLIIERKKKKNSIKEIIFKKFGKKKIGIFFFTKKKNRLIQMTSEVWQVKFFVYQVLV